MAISQLNISTYWLSTRDKIHNDLNVVNKGPFIPGMITLKITVTMTFPSTKIT